MPDNISYQVAATDSDFSEGKKLFQQYVKSLGVDLSFQDFENELKSIQQHYHQPYGALLLAVMGSSAIGCAGIRKIDEGTAELKRMYVDENFRGLHVGVHLLQRSLQIAKELGYKKIRLDTLKSMTKAQELYRSFGFYEIPAYRFNPLEGTIYMEKQL